MSDNKETNVELEALVKAQAEMKEQMEALVKAAAEKDKELEELRKAKEEEAQRLQKALDDQAMEDAVEFVKNLSAVGDEAEREALVKSIFELRSAPESKELLSALTKMQGALDVNMEQKGKETKEVEVITKSADDEVVNFIKATNKARK